MFNVSKKSKMNEYERYLEWYQDNDKQLKGVSEYIAYKDGHKFKPFNCLNFCKRITFTVLAVALFPHYVCKSFLCSFLVLVNYSVKLISTNFMRNWQRILLKDVKLFINNYKIQ